MKSKLLIGAAVGVVVVGAAGYLAASKLGVSADAPIRAEHTVAQRIDCANKTIATSVVFSPGDDGKSYVGKFIKNLTTSETAAPDGIFIRSGDKIYYSNGLKYNKISDVGLYETRIFQIADAYYQANLSSAINISDLKGYDSANFYAYRGKLYQLDMNSGGTKQGPLYQYDGKTEICLSTGITEIDVARKAQSVLNAGVVAFNLKAQDPSGAELFKTTDGVYTISNTTKVKIAPDWSYGIAGPLGTVTPTVTFSNESAVQKGTDPLSFTMVGGRTVVTVTYKDAAGVIYQNKFTIDLGRG